MSDDLDKKLNEVANALEALLEGQRSLIKMSGIIYNISVEILKDIKDVKDKK